MTKANRLAELNKSIESDASFANLASQATRVVLGDGNLDADIVFVGEAPGREEDECGLPFVGASGRFLDKMLAAANLNRDDVYITNIVKYRPLNNRDPSRSEIAEFWPYLLRQIQIIEPQVVITLGRFSMNCFLPDAKISQQHGQMVEYSDNGISFRLIPLYHPAAALYNGSMRQTLIDDFVRVSELLA